MCAVSMDIQCYVIALTRVMHHAVITQPFSLYFFMSYWAYCIVEERLPYKQPIEIKTCLNENGNQCITLLQSQGTWAATTRSWHKIVFIKDQADSTYDLSCLVIRRRDFERLCMEGGSELPCHHNWEMRSRKQQFSDKRRQGSAELVQLPEIWKRERVI